MSNFYIKLVKNIALLLLFTLLSTNLFSHYKRMTVNAALTSAAFTAVPSSTKVSTISRSPTLIPTSTPVPISPPIRTDSPKLDQTSPRTMEPDELINTLNDYRRSKGLSEVKREFTTCELAKVRVQQVIYNFSHDEFNKRVNEGTLPYPSYAEVAENIARVDPDSKHVIDLWVDSPPHRENLEKDTPYVCIAQEADFYVYEGWRP